MERVIVVGWNRVVLVVVAAGAGDRQSQQTAANDVDAVVDDLVLVQQEPPPDGQKAHGGQRTPIAAGRELIGRELVEDELVVTEIGIQRGDDVIAECVGVRIAAVLEEDVALGIGVAGNVQPVPSPALAVPGRGQQAVDQMGKAVGCRVGFEPVDLFGRRGNAREIDGRAADQGTLVGLGRGGHSGRFEPGQNERIDRRADPLTVVDRRRYGGTYRLERPMRPFIAGARSGSSARSFSWRRIDRPRCTECNPLPEGRDGGLGQLAVRRHFQLFVGVRDSLDEQALVGLGRHDRRPGFAPLEHRFAAIQPQARGLLLGSVALHAAVDQDRPDPRLEKLDRFGWKGQAGLRTRFRVVARGPSVRRASGQDHRGQADAESTRSIDAARPGSLRGVFLDETIRHGFMRPRASQLWVGIDVREGEEAGLRTSVRLPGSQSRRKRIVKPGAE